MTSFDTICFGELFTLPDGSEISDQGVYENSFTSVNDCDSTITTVLTVIPNEKQFNSVQICGSDSYTLPSGIVVSESGTYIDTITYNSCFYIEETELTMVPAYFIEQDIEICSNTYYTLPNGETITESGSYIDTLMSNLGCDSIIRINLNVNAVYETTSFDTICSGETYTLPDGSEVNDPGVYENIFTSVNDCDSTVNTVLTVIPSQNQSEKIRLCGPNSYILPSGIEVFENGIYKDTITFGSCFYIHETDLAFGLAIETQQNIIICEGDSYVLPLGEIVYTEGNYFDTLTSVSGCDSIIETYVSIAPAQNVDINASICGSDVYLLPDGNSTNISGNYTFNYDNNYGCDSTVVIHLDVKENYLENIQVNQCDNSDGVFINGSYFTSDTIIAFSFSSNRYCDSVLVYDLKFGENKITTFNASTCEGRTIEIGGKFYIDEGTYFDTLASHTGCDSVIVIYLKNNPSYEMLIDTMLCGQNFFEFNNEIYYESGTYQINLSTIYDCDSIIILKIQLDDAPEVTVRGDTTIQQGEAVESFITYLSEENLEFQWFINNEPIDAGNASFIQSYFEDSEISIEIRKSDNCSARDSYRIKIEDACPENLVTAPNVITPNHDGANDVFKVLNPFDVQIEMVNIFNRWGEMVHESIDFSNPWDGTFRGQICNPDVYTYYIRGHCPSSSSFEKYGNITLIR